MPDVSPIQLIIVMIIALVVLGPKRLPEMGKSLGKGIREFKQSVSGDEEPKLPAIIPAQTTDPLQTAASPRPVDHAVTQQ
jgi:sec-independent protein translocase protein TatA